MESKHHRPSDDEEHPNAPDAPYEDVAGEETNEGTKP